MQHLSASKMKRAFYPILFTLLCVMIVLVFHDKPSPFQNGESGLTEYNSGWYYISNGEKMTVTLPVEVSVESGGALVLYHDAVDEEMTGLTLLTKGAQYDLTITVGKETVYRFDDTGFPRNVQMKTKINCEAELPHDCAGEQIAMSFSGAEDGVYSISAVYVADGDALFQYYLGKDMPSFVIIFTLAVLAVLSIGLFLYLVVKRQKDMRILYVAVFLLLCVVWCFTDSSLAAHMVSDWTFGTYLSFYTFMLLPLPMAYFVRATRHMRRYKQTDFALIAIYANVIGQSLMHSFGGVNFIQMLPVTHIVLVVSILALATALFLEYRRRHVPGVLHVCVAYLAIAILDTIALLLYWTVGFLYYELLFECGILGFVLVLMRDLMSSMLTNMQYRTKMMIYQRLSMEDKLTGLKNRRAFDAYLEELAVTKTFRQNPVMIYMDLNYLKETNDRYGHSVGDQLLVAAADCIRTAYGSSGECFRLGGDEFCAILPSTNQTAGELSARLDEAVLDTSLTHPHTLSIARGISFLAACGEGRKDFEKWQAEADRNMYQDKKRRKQKGA